MCARRLGEANIQPFGQDGQDSIVRAIFQRDPNYSVVANAA
jgi:hypothetical protein